MGSAAFPAGMAVGLCTWSELHAVCKVSPLQTELCLCPYSPLIPLTAELVLSFMLFFRPSEANPSPRAAVASGGEENKVAMSY